MLILSVSWCSHSHVKLIKFQLRSQRGLKNVFVIVQDLLYLPKRVAIFPILPKCLGIKRNERETSALTEYIIRVSDRKPRHDCFVSMSS